jgi:peptidoglycan-associated lipoprotein
MKSVLGTTLLATALAVLGACSSGTKLDNPAPVVDSTGAPSGAGSRGVTTVEPSSTSLDAAAAELMKKSVYFDYDSFVVKDDYRSTIEANSKFLGANKSRKVIIQGNADERGGSEYNLALGQKRAEAVQKSLALLGASDQQMESVSYGKERPAVQGSDEAAWAKNRRAELNAK